MQINRLKFFRWLSKIPGILYVLILLIVIFSIFTRQFATISNLFNLIRQSSVLVIISLGMMMTIISGGIDLSVGSLIGLISVIVAYLLQNNFSLPVAIAIGIIVCSICGLISGLIISKGRIYPFIATFGMLLIIRGFGLVIANGGSIHISNESLYNFGEKFYGGVPSSFWITIFVIIVVSLLMKGTVFGTYIYAMGANESIASSVGIKVDLQKILVYVFCATLAGIAGIVLTSRIITGSALIGIGIEFKAIAVVVIGGTPIIGGRGTILGTIVGAIVLSLLDNGLTLIGLAPEITSTLTGIAILVSVVFAQIVYSKQKIRNAKG